MGALTELVDSGADVEIVALSSEPYEDPEAVLAHKIDNGFAGTFVVGTPEFVNALESQFGADIITPPSSPVVLLSADQTEARLLDRGYKDVVELATQLQAGP